jgi:pyruvate,water dikinase
MNNWKGVKMNSSVLFFEEISPELHPEAGGKGRSLAKLYQAGYPVPEGFVILPSAFIAEGLKPEAWIEVKTHLDRIHSAHPDIVFAVRSSALSEDSTQASFAGEFETVLNVRTEADLHQAIQTVYQSRLSQRVQAYNLAKGLDTNCTIAVIVQHLICADASGVLFTANPVTGQRDQAVVTAAWGLGEAIVSGQVTPDTLTLDKTSFRVLSWQIADKQVMTIRTESGTEEGAVPEKLRRAAVLSEAQAGELVRLGIQIEKLYGMPMDIEWVMAEKKLYIVQARPVTALPEPELPVPTEWKLPKGQYAAMRNNIVELMADPLSPLFATLGLSTINASLHRLMDEGWDMQGIMPEKIITVVNGYAYFNGSISGRNVMRLLFDSIKIAKKMFSGAVERWTETGRPRYYDTVTAWEAKSWQTYKNVELVDGVKQLMESAIDAFGALFSGVIPAAWMTEALFTRVYNLLIKRRGDPAALTYLLGYLSLPIRADQALYSLAEWAKHDLPLTEFLERIPTSQLIVRCESDDPPRDIPPTLWQEWCALYREYLKKYGYTLYTLDFAQPIPADTPEPVLDTLKLYLRGQGVNPFIRQRESAARREHAAQAQTQRLKGLRLKWFTKTLASAQKFAPLREDGLAELGLAYPLIRQMLHELGKRYSQDRVILAPEDIFWLTEEEVRQVAARLDAGLPVESLASRIPQRKAEQRAALRATPPVALPQMKVFGFDLMSLKSKRGRGGKGLLIKGVATSPGRVKGVARVLHSPDEFSQMRPGDVLVASITTPAWTPLFAMASAVVTDVGGPLSHGSIVAREYGIPAVLGTGVATKRILSGQTITVDGSAGVVILEKKPTSDRAPA